MRCSPTPVLLPHLLLAGLLAIAFPASPSLAQEDAPTGGGYGCKSHGNCAGKMYKDQSNLNSWWYPICSGCHFVPTPRKRITVTRSEVVDFLRDSRGFWVFHEDVRENDPDVRQNRAVYTRVVEPARMQVEYRRLMSSITR
jgi:hypothetical protein